MADYSKKPLVLLVHCYILECIGELNQEGQENLSCLAPKLGRILGGEGGWADVVANQLQVGPEFPAAVRNVWEKNKGLAAAEGRTPVPLDFVEAFVKTNFPDLLD